MAAVIWKQYDCMKTHSETVRPEPCGIPRTNGQPVESVSLSISMESPQIGYETFAFLQSHVCCKLKFFFCYCSFYKMLAQSAIEWNIAARHPATIRPVMEPACSPQFRSIFMLKQ